LDALLEMLLPESRSAHGIGIQIHQHEPGSEPRRIRIPAETQEHLSLPRFAVDRAWDSAHVRNQAAGNGLIQQSLYG
jgi:hypothetical protein